MNDLRTTVSALRASHDALASLVRELPSSELTRRSYAADWTIARVLSHLGSQAEIYALWLDAGLRRVNPPANDRFVSIWLEWDRKPSRTQAADSIRASETLVEALEGLDEDRLAFFSLDLFGESQTARSLTLMRLAEHAVHSWDVRVAFDEDATILASSVAPVLETLPELAARIGNPTSDELTIAIRTWHPIRTFFLSTHVVTLKPAPANRASVSLALPAEAFIRLIYGRLDPDHMPKLEVRGVDLDLICGMFVGF